MSVTLKTPCRLTVFLLCLVLLCAGHPPQAPAADVDWSGDPADLYQLQMNPSTATQTTVLAPPADSPSGNTLRVENPAPLSAYVLGGYDIRAAGQGDAVSGGNEVLIGVNAQITGRVYGSYAYSYDGRADSSGNILTINGGIINGGINTSGNLTSTYIYGGHAYSYYDQADASENILTINGGTLTSYVYGGYAYSYYGQADASENILTINGGTLTGSVYGGYAAVASSGSTASATQNTVIISGGTISSLTYSGYVTGGSIDVGTASDNSLLIEGDALLSGAAYGGYVSFTTGAATALAEGNSVTVNGGTIAKPGTKAAISVYGGYAHTAAGLARVANNTVRIAGGTISGSVYGAEASTSTFGTAEAVGNSVTVSGGAVSADVYGGLSSTNTEPSETRDNSVFVSAGTVGGNVYGGYVAKNIASFPNAGGTATITAAGNRVVISGGTIEGSVLGGLAHRPVNANELVGTGVASDNSVSISGGTIQGNVYGGYSFTYYSNKDGDFWSSTAIATNNSVTLTGSPSFGEATRLYGGMGRGDDSSDFYTGNTLNLLDYHENTPVAGVANFQNYNFLVPSTLPDGGAYLRTGSLDLGDSPQLLGVGVTGENVLSDGYSVDLIRSESEKQGGDITEKLLVQQGLLIEYDGTVTTTDRAINLTLTNPRVTENADPISENWAGSLALTAQGADFVAIRGIAAANAALSGIDGYATFTTVKAGNYRYNTGSHVDVQGVSFLAGVAGKANLPGGTLVIGPAFEASYADFDAHGSGAANGGGYSRSFGGALLGRYQHESGAYLDASLRAGVSETDYRNSLRDASGRSVSYDARIPYYGLHVGPGWQWSLTEKATLDVSAAYFWTHLEGTRETLSSGDKVRFKSADSHRLRGGARVGYEVAENLAPYIGAAYEYELDGKARAGAYGYTFKTPSLKGGSGIGEVGVTWNAAPLFIDLGLEGYTGKREGYGGNLMVRFEF